ncbi:MAG: hypothetical protein KGL39_05700 [Patescibacteria group bacterium]|nr:hypothetical protein [Patescibacteria group bacterium]
MTDELLDRLYIPPGLAALLTVGRRVRVRLNGECRTQFAKTPGLFSGIWDGTIHGGHNAYEADALGRIVCVGDGTDHPYYVSFDTSIKTADGRCVGAVYAVSELIPLDDHDQPILPEVLR